MDTEKSYRPDTEKDEDFHIKEPVGGVYKKIKMLMLNSVATSLTDKLAIAREFKLVDVETKEQKEDFLKGLKKEELSSQEFYCGVAEVIFIEEPKIDYDFLNLGEVNRACNDFFISLNGN